MTKPPEQIPRFLPGPDSGGLIIVQGTAVTWLSFELRACPKHQKTVVHLFNWLTLGYLFEYPFLIARNIHIIEDFPDYESNCRL